MRGITMIEIMVSTAYPTHATHIGMLSFKKNSSRVRSSRVWFWLLSVNGAAMKKKYIRFIIVK
jgi:hypothetical protein